MKAAVSMHQGLIPWIFWDLFSWSDLLLSDPKEKGKEEGYAIAASIYGPIYKEVKADYEKLLFEMETTKGNLERQIRKLEAQKKELEAEKARLWRDVKRKMKIPSWDTVHSESPVINTDWIWKRHRDRVMAREKAYMEARAMYRERIGRLKNHYCRAMKAEEAMFREYTERAEGLVMDIDNLRLEIADMKIVLKE